MAKCTLCDTDKYYASENLAIADGWKFTATRGKGGNKYGVFCPRETPEAIADAVTDHVDHVFVDSELPQLKKKTKQRRTDEAGIDNVR